MCILVTGSNMVLNAYLGTCQARMMAPSNFHFTGNLVRADIKYFPSVVENTCIFFFAKKSCPLEQVWQGYLGFLHRFSFDWIY